MRLGERLRNYPWGSASMALLLVSVGSGVAVGLQYDPATPFYSAAALDTVVPFGSFWRSLHFFSSQLFVLFLAAHVAVMAADARRPPAMRVWSLLIASLAVAVLLLFTGYVLRGDVTGEMAGRIAEHILEAVPVVGRGLNGLLFAVSSAGLTKVLCNHFAGLHPIYRRLPAGIKRLAGLHGEIVPVRHQRTLASPPPSPYIAAP